MSDENLTRPLSASIFLPMLAYQHLYLKLEKEREKGGSQTGVQIPIVDTTITTILVEATTIQHRHQYTTSIQSILLLIHLGCNKMYPVTSSVSIHFKYSLLNYTKNTKINQMKEVGKRHRRRREEGKWVGKWRT